MKRFYRTNVISTERISGSMVRIRLSGKDLIEFETTGVPDESVHVLFPPRGEKYLKLPSSKDGKLVFHGPTRPYTVRDWCPTKLIITIDFALHVSGLASDWARVASLGDEIGLSKAAGMMRAPASSSWSTFIGDISAFPAIARAAENQKEGQLSFIRIVASRSEDIPTIPLNDSVSFLICRTLGENIEVQDFISAFSTVNVPCGNGFIWTAGEAKTISEFRGYLRGSGIVSRDRICAQGYWFKGRSQGIC